MKEFRDTFHATGSDLKRFIVNLSTSSKLNNMLKDNLTGALTLTETLNNYVLIPKVTNEMITA